MILMKKTIYIFIIFFILLINSNSIKYSATNDFTKANNLYSKKDITNALNIYLDIFNEGYDNFEVNYNIGCCYFKLEEYGKSRFYFERSLNYKPFDADLFQNLLVLYRIILKDPYAGEQIIMNKRIIYFVPIYITIIILILLTLLTIIFLLIVYIKTDKKKIFLIFFTISFIFTTFFFITFIVQYYDFNSRIFVIKSKIADVYLAPNESDTVLTPLTEGTKGKIKEKINDYIRVKLNDGLSGWIKKENIISTLEIIENK